VLRYTVEPDPTGSATAPGEPTSTPWLMLPGLLRHVTWTQPMSLLLGSPKQRRAVSTRELLEGKVDADSQFVGIVTDVPGLTALHCHIGWHLALGKMAAVIIQPRAIQEFPRPANWLALCDGIAPNAISYTG